MENYLEHLAEQKKIPILGLETYADQMKVINTNSGDKDELNWEKAKNIIHQYILEFKTNDKKRVKQICSLAYNYMRMKLDYQFNVKCLEDDEIFTKRNNKWIPQIINSLEENKTVFVAVGLYHLYGECGLISQLRKDGYEVNPIKLK